ncbi:hypothetical protein D3C76_1022340 [compost metagenome]
MFRSRPSSTPTRCLSTKGAYSQCPSPAILPAAAMYLCSRSLAKTCCKTCSSMPAVRRCWCSVVRIPCHRWRRACSVSSGNYCASTHGLSDLFTPVANWNCVPRWQHAIRVLWRCTGMLKMSIWRWTYARCSRPCWQHWSYRGARFW